MAWAVLSAVVAACGLPGRVYAHLLTQGVVCSDVALLEPPTVSSLKPGVGRERCACVSGEAGFAHFEVV